MNYYKNLKIPVENFYSFLETNNYKHLLKKKSKLSNKQKEKLDLIFTDIFYAYCELIGDITVFDSVKKEIYIELLLAKINLINDILLIYEKHENSSILVLLNELGIDFDITKKIEPQIKRAIRKVKGLKNRYNIFILKKKPKKDKEEKKENYTIDQQALDIELSLDLKYQIDVSTLTLRKWGSMIKKIKTRKNG